MAGLYIHIPFCLKKCDYCDFVSFPCPEKLPEYAEALATEITLAANDLPKDRIIDTVFFGGGTPSLMSGEQMKTLLDRVRAAFCVSKTAEISMECNPGAVTEEKLNAFYAAGVNRLSVGAQSTDAALLERIGRIHTPEQFYHTIQMAVDAGFTNINADVMHALPGQTQAQYLETLSAVTALPITHISSYALILEEGTPLYARVQAGKETLPSPDEVADMEDAGIDFLENCGFRRYEIANFSKDGFACLHNVNYWENGEYIGLGVAAHSCMRLMGKRTLFSGKRPECVWTRWANTESLDEYLAKTARGVRPLAETIPLHIADEMFETVMLGLRLTRGVNKEAFISRFGLPMEEAYPEAVAALQKRGWLFETDTHIALNRKGLDLQNAALQLFMS